MQISFLDALLQSRKEQRQREEEPHQRNARIVSRAENDGTVLAPPLKRCKAESSQLEVILEDEATTLANSLWQQVCCQGGIKASSTMSSSSIESMAPFSPLDFEVPVPLGFLEAVAGATVPYDETMALSAASSSQKLLDVLKTSSNDFSSQPTLKDLLSNHQLRHLMGLGTQTQREALQRFCVSSGLPENSTGSSLTELITPEDIRDPTCQLHNNNHGTYQSYSESSTDAQIFSGKKSTTIDETPESKTAVAPLISSENSEDPSLLQSVSPTSQEGSRGTTTLDDDDVYNKLALIPSSSSIIPHHHHRASLLAAPTTTDDEDDDDDECLTSAAAAAVAAAVARVAHDNNNNNGAVVTLSTLLGVPTPDLTADESVPSEVDHVLNESDIKDVMEKNCSYSNYELYEKNNNTSLNEPPHANNYSLLKETPAAVIATNHYMATTTAQIRSLVPRFPRSNTNTQQQHVLQSTEIIQKTNLSEYHTDDKNTDQSSFKCIHNTLNCIENSEENLPTCSRIPPHHNCCQKISDNQFLNLEEDTGANNNSKINLSKITSSSSCDNSNRHEPNVASNIQQDLSIHPPPPPQIASPPGYPNRATPTTTYMGGGHQQRLDELTGCSHSISSSSSSEISRRWLYDKRGVDFLKEFRPLMQQEAAAAAAVKRRLPIIKTINKNEQPFVKRNNIDLSLLAAVEPPPLSVLTSTTPQSMIHNNDNRDNLIVKKKQHFGNVVDCRNISSAKKRGREAVSCYSETMDYTKSNVIQCFKNNNHHHHSKLNRIVDHVSYNTMLKLLHTQQKEDDHHVKISEKNIPSIMSHGQSQMKRDKNDQSTITECLRLDPFSSPQTVRTSSLSCSLSRSTLSSQNPGNVVVLNHPLPSSSRSAPSQFPNQLLGQQQQTPQPTPSPRYNKTLFHDLQNEEFLKEDSMSKVSLTPLLDIPKLNNNNSNNNNNNIANKYQHNGDMNNFTSTNTDRMMLTRHQRDDKNNDNNSSTTRLIIHHTAKPRGTSTKGFLLHLPEFMRRRGGQHSNVTPTIKQAKLIPAFKVENNTILEKKKKNSLEIQHNNANNHNKSCEKQIKKNNNYAFHHSSDVTRSNYPPTVVVNHKDLPQHKIKNSTTGGLRTHRHMLSPGFPGWKW